MSKLKAQDESEASAHAMYLAGRQLLRSANIDNIDLEPKKGNPKGIPNSINIHVDLRHEYEVRKTKASHPSMDDTELAINLRAKNDDIPPRASTSSRKSRIPTRSNDDNTNIGEDFSAMDQCALEVGRLVLKTVIKKPELSVTDSMNRFFFDTWLEKFNSNLDDADKFSVELLAELQRSITEVTTKFGLDESSHQSSKKFSNFSESMISKTLCGLGMEAYDLLLSEIAKTNPVLLEIKRTLLPAIFSEFPFSEAFDGGELIHIERLFHDAEGSYRDIPGLGIGNIDGNLSFTESGLKCNQFRGGLDSMLTIDENAVNMKSSNRLNGQKYVRFRTWHESFVEMKERYKQQEQRLSKFFMERDALYARIGNLEASLFASQSDLEKLQQQHDSLLSSHRDLTAQFHETVNTLQVTETNYQDELRKNEEVKKLLDETKHMLDETINDHGTEFVRVLRQKYDELQNSSDKLKHSYETLHETNHDLRQQAAVASKYMASMESMQNESKDKLVKLSMKMVNKFGSIARHHAADDEILSLASTALASIVGPLASPKRANQSKSVDDQSHDQLVDYLLQWNDALSRGVLSYQDLVQDLNQSLNSLQNQAFTRDAEYQTNNDQLQEKFLAELRSVNNDAAKQAKAYEEKLQRSKSHTDALQREIKALENENECLKVAGQKQLLLQDSIIASKTLELKSIIQALNERVMRVEEQRDMLSCDLFYYEKLNSNQITNTKMKDDIKRLKDSQHTHDSIGITALKHMKFISQRISGITNLIPLSALETTILPSSPTGASSRQHTARSSTSSYITTIISQIYEVNETMVQSTKAAIDEQLDYVDRVVHDLYRFKLDYEDQYRQNLEDTRRRQQAHERVAMSLEDKDIDHQDADLQIIRQECLQLQIINQDLAANVDLLKLQLTSAKNELDEALRGNAESRPAGNAILQIENNFEQIIAEIDESSESTPQPKDKVNESVDKEEEDDDDARSETTAELLDLDDIFDDGISGKKKFNRLSSKFDQLTTKYLQLRDKHREACSLISSLENQLQGAETMLAARPAINTTTPVNKEDKMLSPIVMEDDSVTKRGREMNNMINDFRRDINITHLLPADQSCHDLTHLFIDSPNPVGFSSINSPLVTAVESSGDAGGGTQEDQPFESADLTSAKSQQLQSPKGANESPTSSMLHETNNMGDTFAVNIDATIDEENCIDGDDDDYDGDDVKPADVDESTQYQLIEHYLAADSSIPSVRYILPSQSKQSAPASTFIRKANSFIVSSHNTSGNRKSLKVLQSTGMKVDTTLISPLFTGMSTTGTVGKQRITSASSTRADNQNLINSAFIDIVRKNEKEYAKEIGYYAVILREAKQLFNYFQEELSRLRAMNVTAVKPEALSTLQATLNEKMRWIFDAKKLEENFTIITNRNTGNNNTSNAASEASTPMIAASQMRMMQSYTVARHMVATAENNPESEIPASTKAMSDTLSPKPLTQRSPIASAKAKEGVKPFDSEVAVEILNTIDQVTEDLIQRTQLHGGWKALLYTSDGKIVSDFDITVWPMNEQVEILQEVLEYERSQAEETKKHYDEVCSQYQQRLKLYRSKSETLQCSLAELQYSNSLLTAAHADISSFVPVAHLTNYPQDKESGSSNSQHQHPKQSHHHDRRHETSSPPEKVQEPIHRSEEDRLRYQQHQAELQAQLENQMQQRDYAIYRRVKQQLLSGEYPIGKDDFLVPEEEYRSLKQAMLRGIQIIQQLTSFPVGSSTEGLIAGDHLPNETFNIDAYDEYLLKSFHLFKPQASVKNPEANHLKIQMKYQPVYRTNINAMDLERPELAASKPAVDYLPIPSKSYASSSSTGQNVAHYDPLRWPQRQGNKATLSNYRIIENMTRHEKALKYFEHSGSKDRRFSFGEENKLQISQAARNQSPVKLSSRPAIQSPEKLISPQKQLVKSNDESLSATQSLAAEMKQLAAEFISSCENITARMLFTKNPDMVKRHYASISSASKTSVPGNRLPFQSNLPQDLTDEDETQNSREAVVAAANDYAKRRIAAIYEELFAGEKMPMYPAVFEDVYKSSDIASYAKLLNERVNYHVNTARRLEKALQQLAENYNDGALVDYQHPSLSRPTVQLSLPRPSTADPILSQSKPPIRIPSPRAQNNQKSPHYQAMMSNLPFEDSLSMSIDSSSMSILQQHAHEASKEPVNHASLSAFEAADQQQRPMIEDRPKLTHFDARKLGSSDDDTRIISRREIAEQRRKRTGFDISQRFRHEPAAAPVEVDDRPSPLVLMSLLRPKTTQSQSMSPATILRFQLPPLKHQHHNKVNSK
jgi:hypothetical protein